MSVLWTLTSSPTKGARPRRDHVSYYLCSLVSLGRGARFTKQEPKAQFPQPSAAARQSESRVHGKNEPTSSDAIQQKGDLPVPLTVGQLAIAQNSSAQLQRKLTSCLCIYCNQLSAVAVTQP